MAAEGEHDRPGAGVDAGQAQVDDLAALRFHRDLDADAPAELLRPGTGRDYGVPAGDPLARATDAGEGAVFDDEVLDRRVTNFETALPGGAQERSGEQAAIDPRPATAVDRALDVGKRWEQRLASSGPISAQP